MYKLKNWAYVLRNASTLKLMLRITIDGENIEGGRDGCELGWEGDVSGRCGGLGRANSTKKRKNYIWLVQQGWSKGGGVVSESEY